MIYSDPGVVYLNGTFRTSRSADLIDVVNPATEERIARIADCGLDDVGAAIAAAEAAVPVWRATPAGERAEMLDRLAAGIQERASELDGLLTAENGSTRWWASYVGSGAHALYSAAARLAADLSLQMVERTTSGVSLFRNDPIGVVAAIVPWNAPQALLAAKLAPALAAGCTVVVKPSPETSLDALMLADIIEMAGFPPGCVNVVTGGRETGAAVVRHSGVRKVSFTGSTAAGREIAQVCAGQLKPVSAELGGKSAAILLDDADLELFADSIPTDVVPFSGQVCYANTRILVHRSRYAEALECLVAKLSASPIGDPADPSTVFGPLVSAAQRERVEGYVHSGLEEGARILLGGGRPADRSKGYFVEPTVFVDVNPSARIFQEEIFGPVVVVVAFDDDGDAVRLANDSRYGLAGAVFGADVERATDVAGRMETGRVIVNGHRGASRYSSLYKDSGLGTVGDLDVRSYLQPKNISQPG